MIEFIEETPWYRVVQLRRYDGRWYRVDEFIETTPWYRVVQCTEETQ